MQLMKNALAEVSLPAEAERILTAYFESTATFMLNRAEEQPDSDAP